MPPSQAEQLGRGCLELLVTQDARFLQPGELLELGQHVGADPRRRHTCLLRWLRLQRRHLGLRWLRLNCYHLGLHLLDLRLTLLRLSLCILGLLGHHLLLFCGHLFLPCRVFHRAANRAGRGSCHDRDHSSARHGSDRAGSTPRQWKRYGSAPWLPRLSVT